MTPGLGQTFFLIVQRDLKLSFRRIGELANPLLFFVIVTTMFPLALSPELSLLRDISAGVLWVAALLSSLLSLDALFRTDSDDGSLEQLVLSPAPLTIIVLGKTCAHWLVSGLPLVLIAPVVASAFSVPNEAMTAIMLSLLLGTPTLSLIGSVGAALTIGLQRGRVLLALLVLPLSIPVLIFGARATDLAIAGEAVRGPLLLLGALLAGAVSLTPLASAAAVRISLD